MSAPQRVAQTSFSTSFATEEVTAELPMLAFTLDQKVAPDDDGLKLRMIDIGRNDGTTGGNLLRHEFGRDEVRDAGAEVLAIGAAFGGAFGGLGAAQVLAMGDVAHLLGDDAGAGELNLRHHQAIDAGEHGALCGTRLNEAGRRHEAIIPGLDHARGDGREAAPRDPVPADQGQARGEVDRRLGIGKWAGGVIDPHGLFPGRRIERDFAVGHPQTGKAVRRGIALSRAGDCAGRDGDGNGGGNVIGHCTSPRRAQEMGAEERGAPENRSGDLFRTSPSAGMIRIRFPGQRLARGLLPAGSPRRVIQR